MSRPSAFLPVVMAAALLLSACGETGSIASPPASMPIIRTSVDHGTAFGKAGKGTADQRSLLEACRFAIDLVRGGSA